MFTLKSKTEQKQKCHKIEQLMFFKLSSNINYNLWSFAVLNEHVDSK